MFDHPLGMFGQDVAQGDRFETARVRRVAVIHALLSLITRQDEYAPR